MQAAKETAANIAASAKSGMEKTKAVVGEKAEKLTTSDPVQRQMATEKKEQRIHQAEMDKLAAQQQNAASRQAAATGGTTAYTATAGGGLGHTTGTHGTTTGHTGLGHTTGTHGTTTGHTGLGHTTGTHGTTAGHTGLGTLHGTTAGHTGLGTHGAMTGHTGLGQPADKHGIMTGQSGAMPEGVVVEHLTETTMGVVGSQYPQGTTTGSGGATIQGPNTGRPHGSTTGSAF